MADQNFLNESGLSQFKGKLDTTYAPLASPALTGTPTAPTAAAGTSNTQIATTAYVDNAVGGISSALIFKGSAATVGDLPTIADTPVGSVYNVVAKGTTTADFVEGAGKVVDAGANVAVVSLPTGSYTAVQDPTGNPQAQGWYEEDGGVYTLTEDATVQDGKTYYTADTAHKWDILGGNFDISGLEADVETRLKFVTAMPVNPTNGDIVQFLGTTTNDYTQGRIYQYSSSTSAWVLMGNGMTPITEAYINSLFA